MSILNLGEVIFGFGDLDNQIAWFQKKGLLSNQPNYSVCGIAMVIQVQNDIQVWHSNTDKILKVKYMCKILSNIWANFLYVFNHANTLSNGMPIYGQTVQYIGSKCTANKLWSSLVPKYYHAYEYLTIYISIWANCASCKVSNAGSN